MNEEIAIQNQLPTKMDIGSPVYMQRLEEWANKIFLSKYKPKHLETANDIVNVVVMGSELGFKPFVSMRNIYHIDGVPTAGIHIFTALALSHKTTYKILRDYEPEYLYYDAKGNVYTKEFLKENKETFFNCGFPHDNMPDGFKKPEGKVIICKSKNPSDYVTEIEFTRILNGEKIIITHSYKWSDAIAQGLATKANWTKMPRTMMRSRCLAIGIRLIGADYTLGLQETSEIIEATGGTVTVDVDGKIVD